MHRLDFLDKLRAIAQNGLYYAKDPFDRERYTQLMDLATAGYAEYTDLPSTEIKERFARELGYITAKVGVQGVVINSAGEMLLEKRKDDGLWGLPSGWLDVGERPQEALAREFMEEAQLRVKVGELLGVYSRLPGEFSQPHTSVHLLYYCLLVGGQIQISHESLEMKFVDHKTITTWHKDHKQQAEVGWSFWAKKNNLKKT